MKLVAEAAASVIIKNDSFLQYPPFNVKYSTLDVQQNTDSPIQSFIYGGE